MYRNRFLGTTDWNTVTSLLSNYSIPIKLADGIVLNRVKEQDDLILIELGTLLSNHECDEILTNISKEKFENMSDKYDVQKRNNSRLVVMDDRFAQTLWQRLKFSNKITKLVSNRKPLGFNVQGDWEISGVNKAMRLNKYRHNEHFAPHKDAQYAPSGDERSLLSLIIYLNDNYEKGETKFYFPKAAPKFNMKGLTIEEEIQAYGGLENGYECVPTKPKKGYAVLFTHNLLHAAMAPQMENSLNLTERIVLRTDVLVQRKGKSLGFAICPEEQEDYVACLNFFREAQQNELKTYENCSEFVKTTEDHVINRICRCSVGIHSDMNEVENLIVYYNHLIFDFDTHRLAVEQLSDEKSNSTDRNSLLYSCLRTLQRSVPRGNPIAYYRVNIEKLAEVTKGFNHASCQCSYPEVKIDQFSFLDYTYLSHVHLAVGQNKNYAFVLATYGGVAAL
ncbi:unnamed protein product [Rotaria sordida]|uniref:Fe2OG dioxygenase domain-containing protein n=1 Tax=Rotaria sordida TaxID=392033 RepID=A0A818XF90_9BILA|nr:unnamed protein product [Rotaria sordida]